MEKIIAILIRKPRQYHSILPQATVRDALSQMCAENTDHLLVMSDNRFLGIISEHDIATKALSIKLSLKKQLVKDVMNHGLPMITANDTVERCMKLMRQHNIRFIPVFDGFNFEGIISADDILQEVMFSRNDVFDGENEQSGSYVL
ncbi:MAG: CBS domain-containing protein [Chitinophagaceae bacterium]|jgi:CBS domain-containing protein|nr:CBS domain-containing protein [Chitinophagaceae bacterium]